MGSDKKFIVTHVADDGEYSRHLNYFLVDGSRQRVTVEQAADSEELRERIGHALHKRFVERGLR